MSKNLISPICLILFSFSNLIWAQNTDSRVDFVESIKPILENNCVRCHGPENDEGGCRLHTSDEALNYIEAGDAENSQLYEYVTSEDEAEMMPPPDEGGPLSGEQIQALEAWINAGAIWPDDIVLAASQTADQTDDSGDQTTDAPAKAEKKDKPSVFYAIGLLHPAVLHLPMGLLMAAGLFALLSLRGSFVMSDLAYYCLWLGTLGAIGACVTGWWFMLDQRPKEFIETAKLVEGLRNTDHAVFWHRTSAIVATIFALILALFAASARNRDPDDGVGWKLGLILLAGLMAYVGHHGGKLSWGEGHYKELYEVANDLISGGDKKEDAGKDPLKPEDSENDDAAADDANLQDVET